MEKELFEEYKPVLKTFTYNQAKLLIRLIDRECNQSSYHLIKAFLGGFRATFWQTFGAMFGVSLRKEWEPEGKDRILEEIVVLVENNSEQYKNRSDQESIFLTLHPRIYYI